MQVQGAAHYLTSCIAMESLRVHRPRLLISQFFSSFVSVNTPYKCDIFTMLQSPSQAHGQVSLLSSLWTSSRWSIAFYEAVPRSIGRVLSVEPTGYNCRKRCNLVSYIIMLSLFAWSNGNDKYNLACYTCYNAPKMLQ